MPSVIIFTGSGLVEIIAARLPPNLADAHLHLTAVSGSAIVHLMLADVRDFAKAERELVERDAVWTTISSGRGSRVV